MIDIFRFIATCSSIGSEVKGSKGVRPAAIDLIIGSGLSTYPTLPFNRNLADMLINYTAEKWLEVTLMYNYKTIIKTV